jgi:hypothetical protein
MGDILKTLVATPASSILLLAGVCFLFIAAAGKIAGKIEPGKTGRFVSFFIGTVLLVLSFGTGTSQQIPSGSYQGTCQNSYVRGETLFSTCLDEKQQLNTAELSNFKSCKKDISNDNGALKCLE